MTTSTEHKNSLNHPSVSAEETITRARDRGTRADSHQLPNRKDITDKVKFIEPWHVVLGDHQRRADRTTDATELLL